LAQRAVARACTINNCDNPFGMLKFLNLYSWLRLGINGGHIYNAVEKLPLYDYAAWQKYDSRALNAWNKSNSTQKL